MIYVVVTLDNKFVAVFSSEVAAKYYIKSTEYWSLDRLLIIRHQPVVRVIL